MEPWEWPLLRFAPPGDWGPFDAALGELDRFRAVAVTSPRAASALAQRMPAPHPVPVWTSGPATAWSLRPIFPTVHVVTPDPAEGAAAAVARRMLEDGAGSPVFFPSGARRREELIQRLTDAGLVVEPVECYRSLLATAEEARAACEGADVLVVASPSVAQLLAGCGGPRPLLLAVGPTTAAAAREAGWPPTAVAGAPAPEPVLDALRGLNPHRSTPS
jgi:uroporphyrinogen-III synthase